MQIYVYVPSEKFSTKMVNTLTADDIYVLVGDWVSISSGNGVSPIQCQDITCMVTSSELDPWEQTSTVKFQLNTKIFLRDEGYFAQASNSICQMDYHWFLFMIIKTSERYVCRLWSLIY